MAAFQEAQSPQYGRHLISLTPLSAGTVVLEQQPYAAVLYDDQVSVRCDWCFQTAQPGSTLMRCTRSKFAHYCSRDHQKAAWKAYYKQECAALGACAPHVPPATVRLAARVLWRRDSELQSSSPQQQQQQHTNAARLQQQLSGGTYADVCSLLSHWQDLDDARKLQYAHMAALTRDFMQHSTTQQQDANPTSTEPHEASTNTEAGGMEVTEAYDVRQIALLIARFACNNHTICDDELRPIGVGIYPLAALINHECRPNCVQTFKGRNIVFRSLQSIPAGQQLTISYIELAATRQERRRQLLEQYFFDIDQEVQQQQQLQLEQQQQQQQQAQVEQQQGPGSFEAGQQAPSGAAAGVEILQAADSMQQSGLHKLRLLVQLPQLHVPGLQQQRGQGLHDQQELLLWTTAADATPEQQQGDISNGGATCSSSNSSRPPWPEDKSDPKLCQMLLQMQQSTAYLSSSTSSSSKGQVLKLSGGMCLLQQLHATAEGQAAASASAALLSGLFKDLEQLGGSDGTSSGITSAVAPPAAGLAEQQALLQKLQLSGQPEQQQQQQQQQLEAVQWGDWGTALQQQQQQQQQTPSAAELAASAAALQLHVWQLQQQAERRSRQGHAASAVKLCQAALAAADGLGPQATCQVAPSAAAAAAPDFADDSAAGDAASQSLMLQSSSSSDSSVRVVLGLQHVVRIRVLAALLCAAVDAAEWQLALQTARQLTPLYELVYPKVWPNLGLHYAMVAKLEMYLEQPGAAVQAAEAAAAILRITHGGGSAVLQEVLRTHYEARQELAAAAYNSPASY